MFFVLLNWLFIAFISTGWGLLCSSFIQKTTSLLFTQLFGLFGLMLFTHTYAIFLPINSSHTLAITFISLIGIIIHKNDLVKYLGKIKKEWLEWGRIYKITAVVMLLITLMQSSVKPIIFDNESYYLQTIKWLNNYGFVKGLANLHLYFGQFSGYHILQSGLNFDFGMGNLNRLNGYLAFVISLYSIGSLYKYSITKIKTDLFIGLLPVWNLYFFQFLNAPSPDLPVFLISQLIFLLFYLNWSDYRGEYRGIFIFSIFLILIKATIFPILLLPFILLIHHRIFRYEWKFTLIISLFAFVLFIIKNIYISGYPLFPISLFSEHISTDWKIPVEIQNLYYSVTKSYALTSANHQIAFEPLTIQYFKLWLFEPGLRGIFNKLIIVLLMIFPFFIKKDKGLFWLYIYAIIQFAILYVSSPQYRFFFPLITGFSIFFLAASLIYLKRLKVTPMLILFLLPIIPLLSPLKIKSLKTTDESLPDTTTAFELNNLMKFPKNTSFNTNYHREEIGNLKYYSPDIIHPIFWITGDGPLPTVNKEMIYYIGTNYGVYPQLRKNDIKDGFRSEKVKK